MVWATELELNQADVRPTLPVKKQVWDGEKFVPMILYKHKGVPNREQESWLEKTYGHAGTYKNGIYWDYSVGGNFTVMDEKVYAWFQMKWSNNP